MFIKLVGLAALLAVCSGQRLQVKVYYESLCSDSAKFILEQLQPTKTGPLGKYFDVVWVPYGKANYTTLGADVQFTCQHGPSECYGNKIHACALQHIQVNTYQNTHTRESKILEYVSCLIKAANSRDGVIQGARCARESELNNWDIIERCANTTEGSKLLQEYGEETKKLNPPLTFVPTITFKDQFTPESQNLALTNLPAVVCSTLRTPRPTECSHLGGGAEHNIAASVITLTVVTLLTRMF